MSRAGGGEPGVARDSKVSGAGALRVETTDDAREGAAVRLCVHAQLS